MPSFDTELANLQTVHNQNLTALVLEGENQFNNITGMVEEQAAPVVAGKLAGAVILTRTYIHTITKQFGLECLTIRSRIHLQYPKSPTWVQTQFLVLYRSRFANGKASTRTRLFIRYCLLLLICINHFVPNLYPNA